MEQKQELKVYLFEGTRNKKNEDGTVSAERETFVACYAFEGDPKPHVDYNRYWEFGDGCLNLVAEDGHAVDSDVNSTIEWMYDSGFRGVDIGKLVHGIDGPGKWSEVCLGDDVKTTLRVTMLKDLPKIDREKTIRNSDLSPAQQHRVLVDGTPLFPEGGAVEAGNPRVPTLVLRTNLPNEINEVWEKYIYKITVTAETRDDLNTALAAIGVLEPEKVAPDSVSGEGDSPYRYVATVILSTEV